MWELKIEFSDIVLLNAELKKYKSRYHIKYINEKTACIEPPGECCLTENMKRQTKQCIERYYTEKNAEVVFSDDFLYFHLEDI
ncbi:MAG TPA: hypothetical protein H9694_04235 [Firmicutes bacterium]|nr:hypothetical protein [Bacillota bacterium]